MIINTLDVFLFGTYFLLLFLAIFWLLVQFSEDKEQKTKPLQNKPFFTTIVPAFNEEESIEATLHSLVNLDYPLDKREIIVVNDGSTDGTQKIVEQFIKLHPEQMITLINQLNKGKGNALNHGLTVAKGEFYACLDADSFIAPNAITAMLPYFEDSRIAAVCPLLKVKKPENILQKVQWYEYVINMFYKHLNAKVDCIHVTPGPFSVYRINVIRELGGYDEKTITEDLEIAIRLQKHHYKIVQTFATYVETMAPKTWHSLFRQRVRWYKGSVDNTLAYKSLMFNRKYGDFGLLRMPTIILSGIIAIILTSLIFYEMATKLYEWFMTLKAINFDLLTIIKNHTFTLNILGLPFSKLFIAATLMGISFFVMVYSFKIVQEKIKNHGRTWISLFTYLFIYSLFISVVWIYIAFMFMSKKKNFWS